MRQKEARVIEKFENALLLPLRIEEVAQAKDAAGLSKLEKPGNLFSSRTARRNTVLLRP